MAWLLPALAEVARRPDVEVVLFGLQGVPPEASFPHRHVGVVPKEAVAALLASAHVVVDPSLFQGFGLVGLEAMSCGTACVLTASGGVSEYAVDGENALVVPPRDADAIARAVLRLVDDTALRDRLAAAGLAAARRFTWEKTAARYREFMASLPPPETATPRELALLRLLGREISREAGTGDPHDLRNARDTRETLEAIYRSKAWKLVQPWRRLKSRLR